MNVFTFRHKKRSFLTDYHFISFYVFYLMTNLKKKINPYKTKSKTDNLF